MRNAIEQYLQHLKLSNASENTIRCYRGDLLDLARCMGDIPASAFSLEHVEKYLSSLKQRNLAKSSVYRCLAAAKSFGRWMADEGLISENPVDAFNGPRRPHHVTSRATEEEIRRFLELPLQTSFPERDRLILELLYGSGLRCDEVANIRADDFVEPDMLLVTKAKGDKQRYVLLTDYALAALRVYLEKRAKILKNRERRGDTRVITGLFFGLSGGQIDALTSKTVYRIVVKIAKDAELSWLSPHDLRRAFATHMDEHGAQHIVISKLLGHAKLSITETYIAAGSPQRLKRAYDRARSDARQP